MKADVGVRRIARGCAWCAWLPAALYAQTTEDIRDIRGPRPVPKPWLLPAVLTGVIVVALCAYVVWRRRHHTARLSAPSLLERTLERLDGTRPLMHPDKAREFGIAASELVRDYIEQRFIVIASQRTSEEFLQALLTDSDQALARHRSSLAQFLQQCDFVKFAGASLTIADMESLFRSARDFVLQTSEATVR